MPSWKGYLLFACLGRNVTYIFWYWELSSRPCQADDMPLSHVPSQEKSYLKKYLYQIPIIAMCFILQHAHFGFFPSLIRITPKQLGQLMPVATVLKHMTWIWPQWQNF